MKKLGRMIIVAALLTIMAFCAVSCVTEAPNTQNGNDNSNSDKDTCAHTYGAWGEDTAT